MISYGYLEQIHRYCKKRYWVDMEELIANLIAQKADEDGTLTQEWNTTVNTECSVLEGLEAQEHIEEENSSDIASVGQTGRVIAKTEGTAIITVKTVDGNKTDQCSVNVEINEEITHTELPSLKIDNNCYFDTEVSPDEDTNVEIKVHITNPDISGTWIAGARDANNKYTLSITDNWYVTRGSVSSAAKSTPFWEIDWTIIQNGADFTLNGTKISCDAASSLTFTTTYYIGNANNNGEPYTGKGFNGTFYYAKLKSGQELVADIIPVKKTDNTLCLYDKVSQKYLYNLGTGNLSE